MGEASPKGELFAALVEFQKECPTFTFDKTVKTSKYSFKYVTLAKLVNETKPLLAKHGLTVIQLPTLSSDASMVRIKTIITHKSGQLISEEFEMVIPQTITRDGKKLPVTPQDLGSAISYSRRYSYGCALGLITDEDTDGHSPAEIYKGTKDDCKWLSDTCKKLGVTDKEVLRGIHLKMLSEQTVKDVKLIQKLID